jgi:hypothetical protein
MRLDILKQVFGCSELCYGCGFGLVQQNCFFMSRAVLLVGLCMTVVYQPC